ARPRPGAARLARPGPPPPPPPGAPPRVTGSTVFTQSYRPGNGATLLVIQALGRGSGEVRWERDLTIFPPAPDFRSGEILAVNDHQVLVFTDDPTLFHAALTSLDPAPAATLPPTHPARPAHAD